MTPKRELALPYIGLTGVVTEEDVDAVLEAVSQVVLPAGYRWMAGILVSLETLTRTRVPNRRYPDIRNARRLAERLSPHVFTTVHYNSRESETLSVQLERARDAIPAAHGFQLNIVRPPVDEIARFRESEPNQEIILQVNRSSLNTKDFPGLEEILGYARPYLPHIEYLLLDLSGGQGVPLAPVWAAARIRELQGRWSRAGVALGVAGGLGPDSEITLRYLREQAPEGFSVDAESRLRRPVSDPIPLERYQDELDPSAAQAYLEAAAQAFREGKDVE